MCVSVVAHFLALCFPKRGRYSRSTMRVTVYDSTPGVGFQQWCLKVSWFLGCWFQKLFDKVDAYYGATSWTDALTWLMGVRGTFTSIQYWGHGGPGVVWLAQRMCTPYTFTVLRTKVTSTTVVWFRTCSTFQGARGYSFALTVCSLLGCVIAGHTRVIGLLQGGLHTQAPDTAPSWPLDEGEFPKSWWPASLHWGSNTVTCLATKIPKGW